MRIYTLILAKLCESLHWFLQRLKLCFLRISTLVFAYYLHVYIGSYKAMHIAMVVIQKAHSMALYHHNSLVKCYQIVHGVHVQRMLEI